jgi:hypothetical protein
MTKILPEIFEEIAKDPATIEKYKDNTALKLILGYAFLPENKFVLPDGDPLYTPDKAPQGMSPTNFYQEIRRLYIFTKAKDLHPLRREQLFIQLLETVHPSEAKLLLAIKDQTLTTLYRGLDVEALVKNGLLPERVLNLVKPEPVKEPEPIKKKRGRPFKVTK